MVPTPPAQDLGHQVRFDPQKARATVLAALRYAHGHTVAAASNLNISERTLFRWIASLNLQADIDKIRESTPGAPKIGRPLGVPWSDEQREKTLATHAAKRDERTKALLREWRKHKDITTVASNLGLKPLTVRKYLVRLGAI